MSDLSRLIGPYVAAVPEPRPRPSAKAAACSGHVEEALLRLSGKVIELRQVGGMNLACQPHGPGEVECDRGAVWFMEEIAAARDRS